MKNINNMKPKTKFGEWLLDMMKRYDCTCADVAKELKTTRQNVRCHIVGISEPSFARVIAYCWMFNSTSNVYDIWELTKEEL